MAVTVAPLLGQLSSFNPEEEIISTYLERTNIFFAANKIEDDKQKVTLFLNAIDAKTYSLLRDLLSPDVLTTKTFKQLTDALTGHFEPKPLVIAERYYFYQGSQKANESVQEYLAELRKLAQHCAFGEFLNDALRDRFVCGLHSQAALKRLLAEPELKLDKAIQIAQSLEAADINSKKLQGAEAAAVNGTGSVNRTGYAKPTSKTERGQAKQQSKVCYRCGNKDHLASVCPFLEEFCNKCHKKGHIARACKSNTPRSSQPPCGRRKSQVSKGAFTIREPESEEESPLNRVGSKAMNPIMVVLTINGQKTTMELDTGAAVSVISTQTKTEMFPQTKLTNSTLILTTYTGEQLEVAGQILVEVKYGRQVKQLPLYVVKGNGPSLMGRNWLQHIKLNWQSLKMASLTNTKGQTIDWQKQVEALLQTHKMCLLRS